MVPRLEIKLVVFIQIHIGYHTVVTGGKLGKFVGRRLVQSDFFKGLLGSVYLPLAEGLDFSLGRNIPFVQPDLNRSLLISFIMDISRKYPVLI